jgi:hypothetical protein
MLRGVAQALLRHAVHDSLLLGGQPQLVRLAHFQPYQQLRFTDALAQVGERCAACRSATIGRWSYDHAAVQGG